MKQQEASEGAGGVRERPPTDGAKVFGFFYFQRGNLNTQALAEGVAPITV